MFSRRPIAGLGCELGSVLETYLAVLSRRVHRPVEGIGYGRILRSGGLRSVLSRSISLRAGQGSVLGELLTALFTMSSANVDGITMEKLPLSLAIDSAPKLVLIAERGDGKTTSLCAIADECIRTYVNACEWVDSDRESELEGLLPVWCAALDYLNEIRREGVRVSPSSLERHVIAFSERLASGMGRLVEDALSVGKAIVLIDDLDKIVSRQVQSSIATAVDGFIEKYPANRCVVALGRRAFEEIQGFDRSWAAGELGELEDIRLSHSWSSANVPKGGELADGSFNGRPRALSLPVAAQIVLGGYVDARRASSGSCDTLVIEGFSVESARAQIDARCSFVPLEARDLVEDLAFCMLESPEYRWSHLKIRRWAERKSSYRDVGGATISPVPACLDCGAGLLEAGVDGSLDFANVCVKWFLAAGSLARRADRTEIVIGRLRHDDWINVAAHLLVQQQSESSEGAKELLDALCRVADVGDIADALLVARVLVMAQSGVGTHAQRLGARILSLWRQSEELVAWYRRGSSLVGQQSRRSVLVHRGDLHEALIALRGSRYWSSDSGEPIWIHVEAGTFIIPERRGAEIVDEDDEYPAPEGELEKAPAPRRSPYLLTADVCEFEISQVPVSNAQFGMFVEATGHTRPAGWRQAGIPIGRASHPVTGVSWFSANAYCDWLGERLGLHIRLPTEIEWEKAALDNTYGWSYPWGKLFRAGACNTREAGVLDTTSVGTQCEGRAPTGCLDMAGNVWEWTSSSLSFLDRDELYPYYFSDFPSDREASEGDVVPDYFKVLKGGSYRSPQTLAKVGSRSWARPQGLRDDVGFRIVKDVR